MPMLHGVTDIGGLDQMLDDNCSLAIDKRAAIIVGIDRGIIVKRYRPPLVAQLFEIFINDIRRQDAIHYQAPETQKLHLVCENSMA